MDEASDDPAQHILDALLAREPLFHREPAGTTHDDIEAMLAPDFLEVGASGARYDRDHVAEVVAARYREPVEERWTITEAWCRRLGADVYLVTYRLEFAGRHSRRSTLWERGPDQRLRVVHHQGTPLPGLAPHAT